jgi:hypothetical protein
VGLFITSWKQWGLDLPVNIFLFFDFRGSTQTNYNTSSHICMVCDKFA